jgi:hypothetical protein
MTWQALLTWQTRGFRLQPRQRKGRTVNSLARHAGGLQTWKIVIPIIQHIRD